MKRSKPAILEKYHLTAADKVHVGMEAEVYALDAESVLKLYTPPTSLENLRLLQVFYANLDRSAVSYALPYIERVVDEGEFCVSIERRLSGTPLSGRLSAISTGEMERAMETYLGAVLELQRLKLPPGLDRYRLFDPGGKSARSTMGWNLFLKGWVEEKLIVLAPFFRRDVTGFDTKIQSVLAALERPYEGPVCVVHGDFFPGNLLVNRDIRPTALLDFGLFTLAGDPFFDLATSWVFFDMYDQLKANLRARYLDRMLDRLGQAARKQLYFYVLVYSLLSANTYSPACSDGHYAWCVDNLNRAEYWEQLI